MKSKLCSCCTACSAVAGVIGLLLIGQAAWQWVDANVMDTLKLMKNLF